VTQYFFFRHIDGEKHIQLHDVAVVCFCADGDEASMSMAFTNVLMLLNYFRVSVMTSDNSAAFKKFDMETMGISSPL
jgi:hypothetical protein